jgi:hypothetical protein
MKVIRGLKLDEGKLEKRAWVVPSSGAEAKSIESYLAVMRAPHEEWMAKIVEGESVVDTSVFVLRYASNDSDRKILDDVQRRLAQVIRTIALHDGRPTYSNNALVYVKPEAFVVTFT